MLHHRWAKGGASFCCFPKFMKEKPIQIGINALPNLFVLYKHGKPAGESWLIMSVELRQRQAAETALLLLSQTHTAVSTFTHQKKIEDLFVSKLSIQTAGRDQTSSSLIILTLTLTVS